MTITAREVLSDCRDAVAEITGSDEGSMWRRRWVTAVVLLRTVGYVLSSIDSNRSPAHKKAINRAWNEISQTKPKPEIFWEFIDKERHNIVHEYELSANKGHTKYFGSGIRIEENYLIYFGHYKFKDQREVLNEALNWLENYLDLIDSYILENP